MRYLGSNLKKRNKMQFLAIFNHLNGVKSNIKGYQLKTLGGNPTCCF